MKNRVRHGIGKVVVTTVIIVVAAAVYFIFIKSSDQYKIPPTIATKLSFPVLFLKNPTTVYRLDNTSIKYTSEPDGSKVFIFVVYSQKNRITISEQAYPDVLIYDKLSNSINPYSEVGTLYGKVTLGRPKDGGGRQAAVDNYTNSTLIFAQPTSDLGDADWQQLFNNLDLVK